MFETLLCCVVKLNFSCCTDSKSSGGTVDSSSKCASTGVERLSQHTKGELLVFIGPAALQRPEDKP